MLELEREIRRIRFVELELARRYPRDVIQSPMHLSLGQEWPSVAVCRGLEPEDAVIGTYRSHALYLAKGGDLRAMLAELYGLPSGCCRGLGGSMHLCDVSRGILGASAIVGSTLPVACGHALAGRRTVAFIGDGATEEGAFYECLNFAMLHCLPLLIICENNRLAVDTPDTRRAFELPADRIKGFGLTRHMAFERGASNLTSIVREWRSDPHPTFIECDVKRLCEHVGPEHDPTLDNADYSDVRGEVLLAFDSVEEEAKALRQLRTNIFA